jgi:hypothetical protein
VCTYIGTFKYAFAISHFQSEIVTATGEYSVLGEVGGVFGGRVLRCTNKYGTPDLCVTGGSHCNRED